MLQWAQQRIEMARLPGTVKVNLHLTSELAESILAISDNSWRTAATHLHVWAAAIANGDFSENEVINRT